MSNYSKENLALLELLEGLVKQHPEQRFSQILLNYKFVSESKSLDDQLFWKDEFYLEPESLLERITYRKD